MIKKKTAPSYEVKFYIGSRENYCGKKFKLDYLLDMIEKFQVAQAQLFPVRVTKTGYKAGDYFEPGFELAVINYARRLHSNAELSDFMHSLARHLLVVLRQNRVTVVEPMETTTYEHINAVEKP